MGLLFLIVTILEAKIVTFDTPLPYTEVIARLDEAVNKQGSADILIKLRGAKSREEIEQVIDAITGVANDFLYFMDLKHHPWLNTYTQTTNTPATVLYTIGNPLIAQGILRHDLRAALHIPPRLLILEKVDRTGTNVIYQLPSSVMIFPDNESQELREAVEGLDRKFEALARNITGLENVDG
ncbi:hypothetical protein P691DRAFT_794919 [Macrolepiota fuliginosa MF-IS2]|uniref:DUF302 domain-containing protein n=1 Tax=Macrolepiota fuliginosa MF-IS2 TaxID=1400762 RepID=A0A9P6C5I3_9AGAR|nr:hypothetical protein P691DRAFT_794919 [Macrolepiota fuliginosa MF-IS2]